jgi:hypothetical protein
MGCGFEPGRCPKNAALEKTGFAWHDGLFQSRVVEKPTCFDLRSSQVTDVCGRAKTQSMSYPISQLEVAYHRFKAIDGDVSYLQGVLTLLVNQREKYNMDP